MAGRANYLVGPPWKRLFVSVCKVYGIVTFAGMMVSAVIARVPGLLGFMAGSLVVFLWFAVDLWVAQRAEKQSMAEVARRLIVTYVLKVVLGLVILFFVPLPEHILNGWLLAGAILAVSVWLLALMRAIMNLRILYFDEYDVDR